MPGAPVSRPTCRTRTKRGATCRGFAPPGRDVCLIRAPDPAEKVAAAIRGADVGSIDVPGRAVDATVRAETAYSTDRYMD